jgi:sortase A
MHRAAPRAVGLAVALLLVGGGLAAGNEAKAEAVAPKLAHPAIELPAPEPEAEVVQAVAPAQPPAPAPVALPTPVAPPADERAPEPAVVIGTIEIPRIGLSVPLNQGISLTSIDRGPSHWPGTALPGQVGNVVVAGHRVTKTKPFRHIDTLRPGDEIIFTVDGVRSVYRVTSHDVVTPDAMHIVDQTAEPIATLFACHPPGSARYRYVVRAALVQP